MREAAMKRSVGRRQVLSGGSIFLAGATAGVVGTGLTGPAAADAAQATAKVQTAGIGWEVTNLHNDGADVYFKIVDAMTIHTLDLDVAMMITSLPSAAGNAEVLASAALTAKVPTFASGPEAYLQLPNSADFGDAQTYNPNGLTMILDGHPTQGSLTTVALRSWVPATGTAAHQSRHVTLPLAMAVKAGSYLTLSMSHAGIQVDCEIQMTMVYTLA
jgi:hypothetical protein